MKVEAKVIENIKNVKKGDIMIDEVGRDIVSRTKGMKVYDGKGNYCDFSECVVIRLIVRAKP